MRRPWKDRSRFFPVVLVLVIIAAIYVLTGCSGQDGRTADHLSAAQIGASIEQAVSLKDLKAGDRTKLQKLYKLNADNVDDFILYISTSNVRADELVIVKLKDASQAESVKAKIRQRIDAQKIKFKDYRPDEYYWVEHHVLKTKGPFVLFAVSKEADKIERAFDDAF
ncbi:MULTISPECIES: DUF4358 domain-containing protein [unclassified Paenibacillus]|uniref:DUF4358 domain-containing protein n=1 Tax=unclassified Paenibacillus TaxID=185978 RepID=UPI00083864BC|nr:MULTISPECIES: DUF4358 domain-containing protein [unclassified Paenibacillus]NWL88071.1 DUF4358 domain-containing protein [Paenibacillus sp. 79R4]